MVNIFTTIIRSQDLYRMVILGFDHIEKHNKNVMYFGFLFHEEDPRMS